MEKARTWRCGRFDLSLERTLVMGVLNATPDSFSDGARHDDPASAVTWGMHLISQGVDIIDVGGESTRPGSAEVSLAAELARVRPVVTRLAEEPLPISVDTRHSAVARSCVEAGASIINDVSGFRDPEMVRLAAECDAGLVIMHMLGEPKTMQVEPDYTDVAVEVGGYLLAQAAMLEANGVAKARIAIDPGIGFGKTYEHNLALMHALPEFASHGYPVLLGVSRKSFIGDITGRAVPAERQGGSIAAAVWGARNGAAIVRVHDVAVTVDALAVERTLSDGVTGV